MFLRFEEREIPDNELFNNFKNISFVQNVGFEIEFMNWTRGKL